MEDLETGIETRCLQLWILEPQPDGSIEPTLIGTVIDGRLYFPDDLCVS